MKALNEISLYAKMQGNSLILIDDIKFVKDRVLEDFQYIDIKGFGEILEKGKYLAMPRIENDKSFTMVLS